MNQYIEKYFLLLFSIIPVSIIIGSSASFLNILIIIISFLSLMFYQKKWDWLFHPVIKLLFLIYLYLILNSFISLEPTVGIYRNLGFIRFIFLFAAFNYFFSNPKNLKIVLSIWLVIISIVFIDVFIEVYTGSNLLGDKTLTQDRIVSFFRNEPIVGGFLNSFYLIIIGYLFYYKNKYYFLKNNYFTILLSFIFLSLIILTGERSNGIKALFSFFLFYFLFFDILIDKKKFFIFFILLTLMFSLLSQNKNMKYRYFDQHYSKLIDPTLGIEGTLVEKFKKRNIYFNLYKSGYKVFKNYPIFGVGNKNYRIESCNPDKKQYEYLCTTHPHQLYCEFLAEHGLVGSMIFLFLTFYLLLMNIKILYLSKNAIQIASFCYLISVFLPLLPSGAFFNGYNLTLFWINFSILYASNPKTNIIENLNNKTN